MRFWFNLDECGEHTKAEESVDLPDIAAARAFALHEARALMAAEVVAGRLCLACRIDVVDETGQIVFALPFRDALALSGIADGPAACVPYTLAAWQPTA